MKTYKPLQKKYLEWKEVVDFLHILYMERYIEIETYDYFQKLLMALKENAMGNMED